MKLRKRFGAFLVLIGMLVALMPLTAVANHGEDHGQSNTCKDQPGFSTNLEAGTSGDWGSVTFTPDSGTLDISVADGYEVKLCIKKGNVDPAITGWLTGDHSLDVPQFPQFPGDAGDGFSHYAIQTRGGTTTTTQPEETTTTQPEETTTTSEPEETTTTVPEETTTTEEEVTTTTTEPDDEEETPVLPFTGPADVLPLAALATMLLASGGFVLRKASRVEDI